MCDRWSKTVKVTQTFGAAIVNSKYRLKWLQAQTFR